MAMLLMTLNANAWKFASATPAEGDVESISTVILKLPANSSNLCEFGVSLTITGDNGVSKTVSFSTMTNGQIDGNFQGISTPGTYTLTVPAGCLHYALGYDSNFNPIVGEANEAQTFTWTIKDPNAGGGGSTVDPWTFASVNPAEGTVTSIKSFTFTMPAGTTLGQGGYVDMSCPDGQNHQVFISGNSANPTGNTGIAAMETPGTYTMNIAVGALKDNANTPNAAMSYTWTIAASNPPATKDYEVGYDGSMVYIKWPGKVVSPTNSGSIQLMGYDGEAPYFMPMSSTGGLDTDEVVAYVTLPSGEYTLAIEAGTYNINGTPNEAISETFTVGGGGGGGNHNFDGQPYHETIFKSGETTVVKPIVFDTEGVTITAVDGEFNLGGSTTTIPFGYNTYSENELDWNNKCQFVITAKKDINKVIFIPTTSGKKAIDDVTAEGGDGAYSNGVWEGKLATGETLTLTSTDGTQIKEIYVCYNGDDFDPTAGGGDVKGVITIQYPVENQHIAKQTDGGKFCVFTTNKEYAQVTIEVKNSNEAYDNLYKFPTRMVDNMGENSDNLHVGENTIYAATPASGASGKGDDWYWFKGDSYTMIVKGYVNPQDDPEDYDAIAEVHFVGDGKNHDAESSVKFISVAPTTSFDNIGSIAMVDGVITLEFDGPVSSVTAVTPMGMGGELKHTATAKAGSDNKVWEINLGDQSGFASAETEGDPIIEIDVTAKDADGATVIFSNDRADRGLVLNYALSGESNPNTETVTLGTPVWSIAQDAEIEASTSSINIKFPNATNVEGTYTIEVSGTIGDKNLNVVPVSGNGTMASGVDLNVSLSENVGYSLIIGTITIKNNGITVYNTSNGNYTLNFGTKAAQGGGTGTNILGTPTVTADKDGITVAWPNADFSGTQADYIAFGEWTLTHKGVDYTVYPEAIEDDLSTVKIEVVIPYGKIATWDETIGDWGAYVPVELANGDEITITIPTEAIMVYEGDPIIYSNAAPITLTTNAVVPGPQPTSVVLYEKEVNAEVAASVEGDSQRDLVIEGTDVTLTISNTSTSSLGKWINNAYIKNSAGGIVTTNTNVMKFTSSRAIEKIEFTANKTITQKNGTNCVGTFANNVWNGEASEISIAIGENVTNISKIVVYFKSNDPKYTETQSIQFEAQNAAGYWATYFNSEDVFIEQTATVYTVNANDKLEMNPLQTSSVEAVNATGTFVPANNAVLLFVDKDTYETYGNVSAWTVKNVDINPLTNNDLYPATKAKSELSGCWFYKLAYNYYNEQKGLGFYWGADDGATFESTKAYLAVPQSVNARSFYILDDSETTGIDNINANVYVNGAYNMAGQRVAGSQKGIMIINGKKVIK